MQWLIDTFTQVWEFVSNLINSLILALKIVASVIDLGITTVGNLPDWLQAFGIVTITICGIYIIVGREAGKSD